MFLCERGCYGACLSAPGLGDPPSAAREGREHEWRVLFARPPPKPRVSKYDRRITMMPGRPFASRFAPHGREVRNRHGQNFLRVANTVVGHSRSSLRCAYEGK